MSDLQDGQQTECLNLRVQRGKAYWAGLTRDEIAALPPNVERLITDWEPLGITTEDTDGD